MEHIDTIYSLSSHQAQKRSDSLVIQTIAAVIGFLAIAVGTAAIVMLVVVPDANAHYYLIGASAGLGLLARVMGE